MKSFVYKGQRSRVTSSAKACVSINMNINLLVSENDSEFDISSCIQSLHIVLQQPHPDFSS